MKRYRVFVFGLILTTSGVTVASTITLTVFNSPSINQTSTEFNCYKTTCQQSLHPDFVNPPNRLPPLICFCGNKIPVFVVLINNLKQIYKVDQGKYLVHLKPGSKIAGQIVNYLLTDDRETADLLSKRDFNYIYQKSIKGQQIITSAVRRP
jgi:hypothetical protein